MNDVNLGTKLFIKLFCKKIGQDEFGNCYYQAKFKNAFAKHKRLVLYKGITEGSKVPALWNAWLHYSIDEVPIDNVHYKWEKAHLPNLTGTNYAYFPSGHPQSVKLGNRDKSTGDYQAWRPF